MKQLPRTIDRSIARMIATKRIITGSLALAAGVGLAIVATSHGAPTPALAFALLIFFGGGAWTLRDGLRLRRELHLTRPGERPRPDPDQG